MKRRTSSVLAIGGLFCLLLSTSESEARGVSPYLPLNMAPEMERAIERVLMIADQPVMSRPIAAARVLDALPAACAVDDVLCAQVRKYLERYMGKWGFANASLELAVSSGADVPLPNRRGQTTGSEWQMAAQAYWQPSDYAIVSLGGVAYDGEANPSGSLLSLGFEYAQLDVGYREHWLSPFTDSAMLMSTNAPTLPSVTLSNYTPIGSLGLQYEIFLAEMETSDLIAFEDGYTSGKPRLAGLRLTAEPAPGWALSVNRLMQFGGGARGGRGFGDFLDALFRPKQFDNTSADLSRDAQYGNQVAAFTSRFIFPGRTPFSVYLEYAGEDTSYEGNYRLGNSALSIGIHILDLWGMADVTFETSEWQNAWYVHGVYQDGLTNEGRVLGHWGADRRVVNQEVGARSHSLRVDWEPNFGGLLQLRMRTVNNEEYFGTNYDRAYDLALGYSRALFGFTVGLEAGAGQDVFGDDYSRVAAFFRLGDEWATPRRTGWGSSGALPGTELFVDAGVNVSDVQVRLGDGTPKQSTGWAVAPHVGVGARRAVSDRSDLGVRMELDRIDGELMLAVRALDYRYRFKGPLAVTAFAGAARYNLATPAYGYYLGAGAQWRDVLPGMDLNFDLRYGDKIARDKLLPSDPGSDPRPDSFYDVMGATLSLSYRW